MDETMYERKLMPQKIEISYLRLVVEYVLEW